MTEENLKDITRSTDGKSTGSLDRSRQEHYNSIALNYDEIKGVQTYEERSDLVCKWLNVQSTDKVVDIGSGTGGLSTLVWKKAGLQCPVLTVDPSSKMLEIAQDKEGLITMEASFDGFLDSGIVPSYNKFIIFASIHHFPQLPAALGKFYSLLRDGDQLLIVDKSEMLLWEAAKRKVARDTTLTDVETYLKAAGFINIRRGEEKMIRNVKRDDYFHQLRNRCYSVLSLFTDEEIEAGIIELNETVFKGMEYKDLYDISCILVATK